MGHGKQKESPVWASGLCDDAAGKRHSASCSASPGKGRKSQNGVGKSIRKSSGMNVAAKNVTSLVVVIGSGQHGGERQHGGVRQTQDAGAADRPDDARSGERRGKSSAKKPNKKDNGLAANGTYKTAYLPNVEEQRPSTSHGGHGRCGARRIRSPNMASDSSHSDMDSDPNRERQSDLSDSDSSDSDEARASHQRHRSRKHKRKSKKSRKHGKKRRYRSPSSCDSSSETSSDTDSDDAPSRPARKRKYRVPSRHMCNGSPCDSGPEQNGGPLSLHNANVNSADNSEDSDDPYGGRVHPQQTQQGT